MSGQTEAAEVAERAHPEAVAARERSRTAYTHLTPGQVWQLLGDSFPTVIERPVGGVPELPEGARVVGYPSAHAIQVALPGHQMGIVESSLAVAKRASHGRYAPIDLTLAASPGGYTSTRSNVEVQIPKDISTGVSTPGNGVTLTPVDPQGNPTPGRGTIDHSSVVYPNTEQATDTIVKPTPTGFQIDDVLRSVESPQQLLFEVNAPPGSAVTQEQDSGIVRVLHDGGTLATILPPSAEDAAGASVPASMSVSGDTIEVRVGHQAGSYLYPIEVDPEVNDSQLAETSGGKRGNWEFKSSNEAKFGHKAIYEGAGKEHLETTGTAEYKAAEFAYWAYATKGNSKIYELKTKSSAKNKLAKIESILQFAAGSNENWKMLSNESEEPEYTEKSVTICGWNASKVEECLPAAGKEKNAVRFQQSATASPGANFKFMDILNEAIVSISEPSGTHSTTSFNTTSSEVEGEVEEEGKKVMQKRTNALYGSGIWLTKSKGALQLVSKDVGIGVSATRLEYEKSPGTWSQLSEHKYLEVENACQGVQCYAEHAEYWTLDPKLPEGEDKIRYRAEEAMSGTASPEGETASTKTVKVDTLAPHAISLSGLPYGNELSEKPYKLVAHATDGEGTTIASSGIKKLELYVSGHEITELGTQTGCTTAKGACVSHAEWSLNGAELGAGHHAIVIVATDNAGNQSRLEETISIRHSTPVPLGPGSVDLQSGDFSLGGPDVSMGSGLTVSRSYSSRALAAGAEGQLGSQWSMSLGNAESLTELVDGSILLTDANGAQTIFASLGEGEFESPVGDSNLTLKLEENKETKVKLAYYLEDAAKHSKTKFTLPGSAGKVWMPTTQEGPVSSDTVTYSYQTVEAHKEYKVRSSYSEPEGITNGPDGQLWFVNGTYNTVEKMTTWGSVTAYALPSGSKPAAIAEGPDGNMWFTDYETNKIGKITTTGEITEYALPGSSGPYRITSGPDGNLWFTNHISNKIGKITTSGTVTEYALPASSVPGGIVTGPDGKLWFTDTKTNKVGKITTSGTITEYAVPTSSEPFEITAGPDGNLWYTDWKTNKIGKITTSGTITEYALPAETGPAGITTGPDKNLWFTTVGTSKVGKITTSGTITEYAMPKFSALSTIVTGPDGNLWFSVKNANAIDVIKPSGTVIEPSQILAPVPAGVSCAGELKAGCRALTFSYASSTTATGESSSEWGDYAGDINHIDFTGYDPVSKKMTTTAVAQYAYDPHGHLRAEWDPRVSPALKTTYGYDAEGHVTAVSPPGQEPWLLTYGTTPEDTSSGRLINVVRASASTSLGSGAPPVNTKAPEWSGSTPFVVDSLYAPLKSEAPGEWSNTPLSYSYQWVRCNVKGEACVPIGGANNSEYQVGDADVGHTVALRVGATNAGGTTAAFTSARAAVRKNPQLSFKFGAEGTRGGTSFSVPNSVATDSFGDYWVLDSEKARVVEESNTGTRTEFKREFGSKGAGAGQLKSPQGIAASPYGKVWVADTGNDRIEEFDSEGKYVSTFGGVGSGPGQFIEPVAVAAVSDIISGTTRLWVVDRGNDRVEEFSEEGEYAGQFGEEGSGEGQFYWPTGIAAGPEGEGEEGSVWVTDAGNSRVEKFTFEGEYEGQFGEYGSGNGQFQFPAGIAARVTMPSWGQYETTEISVTDEWENRVQDFSPEGEYASQFGSSGSGPEEFYGPTSMAVPIEWFFVGETYVTWIADSENNRVESFGEPQGGFVEELTTDLHSPPFKNPYGMTMDNEGHVWVADRDRSKIDEFSPTGERLMEFSSVVDPMQIAIDPGGHLWVTNEGGHVYEYSTVHAGEKLGEVTLTGRAQGLAFDGKGDMWVTDPEHSSVDEFSPSHELLRKFGSAGTGNGQFKYPSAVAIDAHENAWVVDEENKRVQEFNNSGEYVKQFATTSVTSPRGIAIEPNGDILIADEYTSSGSVREFSSEGAYLRQVAAGTVGKSGGVMNVGSDWAGNFYVLEDDESYDGEVLKLTTNREGFYPSYPSVGTNSVWTIDYNVPTSGWAAPHAMSEADVAKWGQSDVPVEGTAIFPPDKPMTFPAREYTRATVYYLDSKGHTVNVARPSAVTNGSIATTEYNELNDVVRNLTPDNRVKALEEGGKSAEVAKLLDSESTYNGEGAHEGEAEEPGTRLIETLGPQHEVKYMAGSEQKESLARSHTKYFYDESAPGGEHFDLVTKMSNLAQLANEEEVEVRKTTTSYSGQSNLGWKLRAPTSVTVDPEGKNLTHTTLYDSTTGLIKETRGPAGSGGESAHDLKYVYYSAAANTEGFSACGSHPEWAELVCETLPAKQPSSGPSLPVTVFTYNMWNEPTVTTETFGTTVRTKTQSYDEAGRVTGSETTSSANTALPKVTDEYNTETGIREKENITVEAKTKTLTSKYNKLGQLTEYTDSDSNTAKYTYGGAGIDNMVEELSDGSGKKQTYTYNSTTMLMEKLKDSAAETFTATYDAEGHLTSEVYPNGMCANTAYNSAGEAVHLEYIKTTNCGASEPTVWFSELRVPSVRGQTFRRESTLANESYKYDTAGRLTETQETPTGKGCTVRVYAYDEESNRTSLTTRAPGGGGACAGEGGTVQEHTYDEANRLTDSGISYDSFGSVTKLPAADAEGHEVTSTFYVDNAVATQSQNGVTNSYYLDPEGRVRETTNGLNVMVTHYDYPGSAVAWTSESGGKSTRNIPGMDGTLVATQTNGGTPVLQLHDLQGNVAATAALSTGATELLSTYNSTEFGVPNKETAPPKFAWLGAEGVASTFATGIITYGATSYVPQIGRALQSEATVAPGASEGTGAGAQYTAQQEPWVMQGAGQAAAEAPGREAARELAAAEAALRASLAAGGEDPEIFMGQKAAIRLGEKLNKADNWSEVWEVVFGLLGIADPIEWVEGAVVGVFSLDVMQEWLHNTGGKLEQCGKNTEKWVSTCKLKYDTVLKGLFVDPFSTSEVEKCGTYFWYAKKIFAKEEWECRRLRESPSP